MAETKAYIYTMYRGADPGAGWELNDPIFHPVPTMGACMPNLRRQLQVGDSIFAISGKAVGFQQYIVGGFRVAEKIDALAAFARFPYYRLRERRDGNVNGNIIVSGDGSRSPLDQHETFINRVENYIVGADARVVEDPVAIEQARRETVPFLRELFHVRGDTVQEVIGRQRRLDEDQIAQMYRWLDKLAG